MKIYLVGGAIRDELMGKEPKDLDYVVVGATPDQMLNLGYKQVGSDFPVFLHPETGEEYALARTEVKNGDGYQGFNCHFGVEVTLEEDLARRDLTINAMAKDLDTGEIIDPFGGRADLENKVLRHTTTAFAEDPLRVLRVARFLSRFGSEWHADAYTKWLCYGMSRRGDLDHLTKERVWLEIEKTLKEPNPEIFFDWLFFTELFPICWEMIRTEQRADYHPEGNVWNHTKEVMQVAAQTWGDPEVNFAAFCHDFGKPKCQREDGNQYKHDVVGAKLVDEFCKEWKVPNNYRDLAVMTARQHTRCHNALKMRPEKIMKLFEETNALAKSERFDKMLKACVADARGRTEKFRHVEYPQCDYLLSCLKAVKELDTKSISAKMLAEGKQGKSIGHAIRKARVDAITEEKRKWKN